MEKPTSVNYDSLAEGYNEWAVPSELSQRFHAAIAVSIREMLPGNVTMVDLGCGPGDYSMQIAQQGIGVIAVDISEDMLRFLSRKFVRNANLPLLPCRVDAHHLPLEKGTIDAVLASQVLHFVSDPMAVVVEIKRGCAVAVYSSSTAQVIEVALRSAIGLISSTVVFSRREVGRNRNLRAGPRAKSMSS